MLTGATFDFQQYLSVKKARLDAELENLLKDSDPELLWESMRYSVLSGGKRIRGVLCLAAAEATMRSTGLDVDVTRAVERALHCACAIELVHAMSLIHDDLPCMDNDDFRRGRPTNHKVFGEAMALLSGDALLVMASEVLLANARHLVTQETLLDVLLELLRTSGAKGLVGGQVADLLSTGCTDASMDAADTLRKIHERKTGALITFSVWSGARLCDAPESLLAAFKQFGQILGLSFQIADDLLDITGTVESLGKTPGKDQAAGKLTWVSVFGEDSARRQLRDLEQAGKAVLMQCNLPPEAIHPLAALLEYAIHRRH